MTTQDKAAVTAERELLIAVAKAVHSMLREKEMRLDPMGDRDICIPLTNEIRALLQRLEGGR